MSEKDAQIIRRQFIKYFRSIDWQVDDSQADSLCYSLSSEQLSSLEVEMYFGDGGLSVFSTYPILVMENNRFEVMILITEINNLPMPGWFVFDIDEGTVGFRTFTHYGGAENGFSEQMIADIINAHPMIVGTFGHYIMDVTIGYKQSDEVVEEIKRLFGPQ